jgi:hypothetical protein
LYEAFGRKRMILFPEESSKLLSPFGYWSRAFLQHMSEREKSAFIDFAEGYDCTLNPGDTLFIPAGMWHYAEYSETAMSFSFRFGRSNYNASLCDLLGYYHGTTEYQHIAAGLVSNEHVEPKYMTAYRDIGTASMVPYESRIMRFRSIQRLLERICHDICPEKQVLIHFNSGMDELLESMHFGKLEDFGVERYVNEFKAYVKKGEISHALGCARRLLSINPAHPEMSAMHARLARRYPNIPPRGGLPIVSMLDTSKDRSGASLSA